MQFRQGYIDEAFSAAEKGYGNSAQFPELNWKFRILLADAQTRKGETAHALELLDSPPPAGLPADVAWSYTLSRSYTLCHAGRTGESETEFRNAEALAHPDPARRPELAMTRGRCELEKGNFKTATDLFREAEQDPASDQFTKLYSLFWLGVSAMRAHQFEEANVWFLKALEREDSLKAFPLKEATQGNLGFIYSELGDFEKALKYSQAAAEGASKLGIVQHEELWLLDTGRAYGATGQSGTAEEYYRKALSLAREDHNEDVIAKALHNLVQIQLLGGDLKQAIELHSEAAKLTLQGGNAEDFNFDEAFIASEKHDWDRAKRLLIGILPRVGNDSRRTWMVQFELAKLYAAQGKVQSADEWFQRSINTMFDEAARRKNIEFRIAILGNLPIFDQYIAFLVEQNLPERALQVAQMARARTLAEASGFKPARQGAKLWVSRIKTMLGARKAVLLAYYEAEHETYLWVITPTRFVCRKLGMNQNDLETLADSYNQEVLQHTSMDSSPAQQRLYQILIKPVREMLPKNVHVFLVGDSALYRINFESLISDDGPRHYWIRDAEVENASSIDLLLTGAQTRRNGRGLLLIGDPEPEAEFPRLPNAHKEMESVETHFPRNLVKTFSGKEATPAAYLSSNPEKFRFIEFATHGEASSSDPLDSFIVLSSDGKNSFRLYARDIVAGKKRLNAELVSLSACKGAGTFKTSAEGLLGLQWAFMRAGAHQVVAGLWDVDDESTPMLMGGLYEGIIKGRSASAALRQAKLKLMASEEHRAPYYWAPLQVYTGQ